MENELTEEQALDLAEQMWEKHVKYMLEQGWEEECFVETKSIVIKMWTRQLVQNPLWVPVRTVYWDGRRVDGTMTGGIKEVPMDFLRKDVNMPCGASQFH
jgi:hypothetical protein